MRNQQNGVDEWEGWSFADKDFWSSVDDQRRTEFARACGTVAVADSDEYERMTSVMSTAINPAFQPTAETPRRVDSVVPTSNAELFKYLQAGSYKQFAAKVPGSFDSGP